VFGAETGANAVERLRERALAFRLEGLGAGVLEETKLLGHASAGISGQTGERDADQAGRCATNVPQSTEQAPGHLAHRTIRRHRLAQRLARGSRSKVVVAEFYRDGSGLESVAPEIARNADGELEELSLERRVRRKIPGKRLLPTHRLGHSPGLDP